MTNPTGYTALDLVGFTDRGPYVSNVPFVKNDIVHYGGNLWKCKIDDTTNVTPAEGANWTLFIGEPTNLVERIIAPLEENPATVAYAVGRQIIYDDYLWEVIAAIAVGDPLVDYDVDPTNANIKKSPAVETQLLDVKAKQGTLTDLLTTVKTSVVAAINEVVGIIGSLSSLTTTVKTSVVAAINEVKSATTTNATGITNTQEIIAPVETNASSASQGYAIGEQFILNGLLSEATAAITQGAAFVLGGNYKLADSVAEQIKEINDTQLKSYTYARGTTNFAAGFDNVDIPFSVIPNNAKCVTPYFSSYDSGDVTRIVMWAIKTSSEWRICSYSWNTSSARNNLSIDYLL